MNMNSSLQARITRCIQRRFDCDFTALPPFDNLHYVRAAALRPEYILRSACV